jgi:hypothetical protein
VVRVSLIDGRDEIPGYEMFFRLFEGIDQLIVFLSAANANCFVRVLERQEKNLWFWLQWQLSIFSSGPRFIGGRINLTDATLPFHCSAIHLNF